MKRIVPPPSLKATLKPGEAADPSVLMHFPIDEIDVLPGFNIRVEGTPEFEAGINALAASIEVNGFYQDKPLAGYLQENGRPMVVDGHRRRLAALRANENSLDGPVVTTLPVVVKPEQSSMLDLIVAMMQSATGEPLTMFEKGVGVRRLLGDGMTKEEIATRLNVSEKTIDNYVLVASAPAKARDLLLDGKVTSTQVLRVMNKPETAAAKLQAMVKTALEKGRTRARPSDAVEKTKAAAVAAGLVPADNTTKAAETVQAATSVEVPVEPIVSNQSQTFTFVKDGDMASVVKQVAVFIRSLVPYNPDDLATADALVTVSVSLPPVAGPAKSRRKKPVTAPEPKPVEETAPDPLAHAIPDEL